MTVINHLGLSDTPYHAHRANQDAAVTLFLDIGTHCHSLGKWTAI
jgi:hypothetical protein